MNMWGSIFTKKGKSLLVTNIELSKDGSAMVINNREVHALCHFCTTAAPFATRGAMYKPEKWTLIQGGTYRQPKRFFICLECAKKIVHRSL